MRAISFNLQKDRDHAIQYKELLYFTRQAMNPEREDCGLVALNEAYALNREVKRVAAVSGYGVHHPDMSRGMDHNALLWDLKHWTAVSSLRVVLLAKDGYQSTGPRWSPCVVLERRTGPAKGERFICYVRHDPPNIERYLAWIRTPQRWGNFVESQKSFDADLAVMKNRWPRAHVLELGDRNVTWDNRSQQYFPARWEGERLGLKSAWTAERETELGGTFGRRPIDDMRHSRGIVVDDVSLAAYEASDHEPPIFDFHVETMMRGKP